MKNSDVDIRNPRRTQRHITLSRADTSVNRVPVMEPMESRLLLSVAVIGNPLPTANQLQVPFRPTLSANVSNADGHTMDVTFRIFDADTSAWVSLATFTQESSGTFTADTSAYVNNPSTNYQWSVTAVDTVTSETATKTYTFTTDRALKLKFTVQMQMSTEYFRERQLHPLMGDVDHDGTQEIILPAGDTLYCINGKSGTIEWRIQGDARETAPELADLDGDGTPEILYGLTGARLRAVNGDGSIRWTTHVQGDDQCMFPILTQDLDGDGHPTIFFLTEDQLPNPYSGNLADYRGALTKLDWQGHIQATTWMYHPCWGGASLADVNGDGKFEIFVSDRRNGYNGVPAHGLAAYDANTLTMLWSRPDIMCSSAIPMLADANNDGKLEVIAQKIAYVGDMLLDPMTGETIRDYGVTLPTHGVGTFYDVNEDGHPDLIIATSYPISDTTPKDFVVFDLITGKIIFRPTFSYWATWPPRVGDVIGDGHMEILAAMGDQGLPYNVTGSFPLLIYDHNFNLIETVPIKDGQLSPVKVYDTDSDGLNEVIVTGRAGRLYVYDTQAATPDPAPNSWVQGYSNLRQEAAVYIPPPALPSQAPTIANNSIPDGATNVSLGPTLSVTVQDPQNDRMNLTFEISSGSNWHTMATYSNVIAGNYGADTAAFVTANDTLYTWRVTATDSGGHSSQKSFSFTTIASGTVIYPDWAYRASVTIDHTQLASDATDFTVLVDVTSAALASHAQSSGNDIFFTAADGTTKLSHEIESYDAATGHLVAWVKVPSVSASSDTSLYMYYGNPTAANQQDATAVWDANYLTVQHLEEQSGPVSDSSSAHNDGTAQNGVSQGVAASVGGGYAFDGVNDRVTMSPILSGKNAFTIETLVNPANKQGYIFSQRDGNTSTGVFLQYYSATRQFELYVNGTKLTAAAAPNQWYQVAATYDGTTARLYLNGKLVASAAATLTVPSIAAIVGDNSSGTRRFSGSLDELRVSSVARSDAYIGTTYNNVFNRNLFIGLGIEESRFA